jgi:hypothetical protein
MDDDEPLLYHTGLCKLFPAVRAAVARVVPQGEARSRIRKRSLTLREFARHPRFNGVASGRGVDHLRSVGGRGD